MSNPPSLVSTEWGQIEGRFADGVHIFKGVRYGASTADAQRFRPPRPPTPWTGVRPTVEEGPQCVQIDRRGPRELIELPESEDCLRLNVWTPSVSDGRRRPVMVWLHGGGLWRGSAAGAWEDWPGGLKRGRPNSGAINSNEGPSQEGRALARRGDVVVVSPNHRIGVLGFLYLEHHDPDFVGSGNVGVLDLVAALRWVKSNIAEFGGDPDNVTIFGLSGGGQKVSLLMAMPRARGLFHKAIIMSGPAPRIVEPAAASEVSDRILWRLGLWRRRIRDIQTVPAGTIMDAYYDEARRSNANSVWGIIEGVAPVVDGNDFPDHPFWDAAPACSRDVPLLIGRTRTEMTEVISTRRPDAPRAGWHDAELLLRPVLGNRAAQVLGELRRHHPDASPWLTLSLAMALWPTGAFTNLIAEQKARQDAAPVFMYRTDWRTPVRGGVLMSPHAIDSSFAMDTVDADAYSNGGDPEAYEMARRVSGAWVEFARSGRPAAPDLPAWPAYDEAERQTMLLDLPSQVVRDPDAADRRMIAAHLDRYRRA